jgi:acetyl esterase/lipase
MARNDRLGRRSGGDPKIMMRPMAWRDLLLGLAFVFVCAGAVRAQEPAASPAATAQSRVIRGLSYVANGCEHQKLDLYLPAKGRPPRPLVAWVHGGGWNSGGRAYCPAKPLVSLGYAVASIDYRLTNEAIYPAQVEDCKAAIRWLRAHAGEYGLDPQHIGAWGESAGGHLVALLGTTGDIRDFDVGENLDQSGAVQCVIDWYGPADFLHWGGEHPDLRLDEPSTSVAKLLGGTVMTHADLAREASPVHFVNARSAPFLIMHGDADKTVPQQQSEELNAALKQAGVATQLIVLPGAGHGGPAFRTAENIAVMAGFLDRYLQPKP